MAIALVQELNPALQSQGAGTSSNDFTFAGTTAGSCLILMPQARYDGAQAFTTVTISGETVTAIGTSVNGNDIVGRFYVVASLSSGGSKTATVNYTGGSNGQDIGCPAIELSSVDTTTPVPTVNTLNIDNPTTNSITTVNNNSAVIDLVKGGSTDGGTMTGYTMFDIVNIFNNGRVFYDLDVGTAGSQTLNPSDGWWSLAIEVKASTGGGAALTDDDYPGLRLLQAGPVPPLVSVW
jgi:hypothetical protein